MKQRLRKLISGFLCFALIASAFVGALSASVLPAKAEIPLQDGYLDDLLDDAREICPAVSLSQFDSIAQQLHDHYSDWLIVVMNKDDNWYFASYEYNKSKSFQCWYYLLDGYTGVWNRFVPRYPSDISNMTYYSRYGFKIVNGIFTSEPYNATLNYYTDFTADPFFSTTSWYYWSPDRSDLNESSRYCFSNSDLYYWDDNTVGLVKYMDANLNNGSFVPPVIDFHWFKFQLGQRWYVTTYDQSLIANLETGDDTYWIWLIEKFPFDFDESEQYVNTFVRWRDIQFLPGAENFISQTLSNIDSSGVLAYDITDLILSGEFEFLGRSKFYQILDGPSGPSVGNLMAQSDDYIDLVLTPDEVNESQNTAWTEINNYIINYPTISIVPEVLVDQLSGHNAVGSGMGAVRAPNQIQQWMNQVYFDTDFFQYDLSVGGLDPSYESIINFDILDTIIVPAENILSSTSLDYWDHTYQLVNGIIDTYRIGNLSYDNPLFEEYDLILITKSDAQFMGDVSQPYNVAMNGTQAYVGDIRRVDIAHDLYYEPVYWILTKRAIQKSQLFVFCDSQSKLYKLLSEYVERRSLWDSSFLSWSLSIFWELETVNGHLMSIETEILSWDLDSKLSSIVTLLQEISDNTSETDVDPWYLALFNWIKAFEPSNFDFIGWVEEYDDFVDDLPDPGGATIIPFPTVAPTVLPTVAVAGG